MDETINEADVKSCLLVFNRWQSFLADAATNNLSGHGSWAATLLRELRNIISAIELVSLHDFCGNCESFISQLIPADVPPDLPPISKFEKFHVSLNVLTSRISKCELPIVFKYPQSDIKKVETLSSLSARFDKRIATASKIKELKFLMGKQNYYDTLGQVISVVHTRKSSTILRIWDATIPQSVISTERSRCKLFRYSPEDVVETLIDDKSGLLQNIPNKYLLDIDLYGRSLAMSKNLQAGDIILVANVHLNWRKHEDYVIPTLHDGPHEFKFNRGVFHVQPNHPRYFDILGSISNELCIANLSGLASMMESFDQDSLEAREQAEASILRARNSTRSDGAPTNIPDVFSNARLLEELQANDSSISIGLDESEISHISVAGPIAQSVVLPQSLRGRRHGTPIAHVQEISTFPTSSYVTDVELSATQRSDPLSISSADLFLSVEESLPESSTNEDRMVNTPRRSSRLKTKTPPTASGNELSASKKSEGTMLCDTSQAAAMKKFPQAGSLTTPLRSDEKINIATQDLNLSIEVLDEDDATVLLEEQQLQNILRDPSQDANLMFGEMVPESSANTNIIMDTPRRSSRFMAKTPPTVFGNEKSVSRKFAEEKTSQSKMVKPAQAASVSSLPAETVVASHDPKLTIEELDDNDDAILVSEQRLQSKARGQSHDLNLTIEEMDDVEDDVRAASDNRYDEGGSQRSVLSVPTEDLELSIEQLSEGDNSFIDVLSESKRLSANLEDLELTMEEETRDDNHDVTLMATQDLYLTMEQMSPEITPTTRCSNEPRRSKRRSSENGSTHTPPASAVNEDAVASRTRSHDRITRKKSRTSSSKR